MKRLPFLAILVLLGCQSAPEEGPSQPAPLKVKVTHPIIRDITTYRHFPATVVYLNKARILSPFSGYLTSVQVKPGDRIMQGQALASLESKEHRAMAHDSSFQNSEYNQYGVTTLRSKTSGFVAKVQQTRGDYVQEGSELFAITADDQVFFKTLVEVNFGAKLQKGEKCRIYFRDTLVEGVVAEIYNNLAAQSQSLQVLVRTPARLSLREGEFANVSFAEHHLPHTAILPKSAVLSDEKLQHFWIMKVVTDTLARRIDVKTGPGINDSVTILSPNLSPKDQILTEGNYGVPDTVHIQLR